MCRRREYARERDFGSRLEISVDEGIVTVASLLATRCSQMDGETAYQSTATSGRLLHPEVHGRFRFAVLRLRPEMEVVELRDALGTTVADATT